MAQTSGSFDVNTLYPKGYNPSHGNCFHPDGYIQLAVNYTCTRGSESSATTTWNFSFRRIKWGSYGSGYELRVRIIIGSVSKDIVVKPSSEYISTNKGVYVDYSMPAFNVDIGSSKAGVTVQGFCYYNGSLTSGCSWNGNPHSWYFEPDIPAYNPYTPAQITTNSISPSIAKLGDTYTVKYTITQGTGAIDWTRGKVYDSNNNFKQAFDFNNKSGGTFTNTIRLQSDSNVTYYNGSRYYVTTRCSDNTQELESNRLEFYTYQKPTINNSISIKRTTQTPLQDNSFTISGINNRQWSSLESDFVTRYRVKKGSDNYTGWTSLGNVTTWSRTASEMKSFIPKNYDGQNIILQMERYSPAANWESDNKPTTTFKVYYRPRMDIPSANITLRKNNSSGATISQNSIIKNDNNLTGINISWTYNTDSVDSGYVQGYRVRLYNSSGNVAATYYTTSKNITIPKSDIPKLQSTQIDITAYYGNDQSNLASSSYANNYWYYNGTITKTNFVKLISSLGKPVIDYPVQNGNWLNTDYRICFTLPEDADYTYIGSSYVYENIEIQINGKYTIRFTDSNGTTTSGTLIKDNTCFSTTTLSHKKAIVVYPNKLSSITLPTGSNTVKVRVKKKYETDSSNTYWSEWSDLRTFNVTPASYSVNTGDLILARHFNDSKDLVNRVRNTYGVSWSNMPANAVSGSTIISTSQYGYNNMYSIIVDTKNKVNGYASFDTNRQDIKLDIGNTITENFTPVQEIVTALSNETNSPNGRNYMAIIYDRCNKLK